MDLSTVARLPIGETSATLFVAAKVTQGKGMFNGLKIIHFRSLFRLLDEEFLLSSGHSPGQLPIQFDTLGLK